MKRIQRLVKIIILLSLMFMGTPSINAQETLKLGVLQTAEHDAFNAVLQGFQETLENSDLELKIEWEIQNAAGDRSNLQSMSEKLARDNEILLAIGTPAAQALAHVESKKPIFIAAVTDPVKAGVVKAIESTETNVTGTSNLSPIKEQVDLLVRNFPETKTVGLIYNSSEVNSQVQIDLAVPALEAKDIAVEITTVTSTNDVAQVMTNLVEKVDAVLLVTDTTVESAMSLVGDIAKAAKIPLVGGADTTVKINALATLSYPYYKYGVQTAEMVIRLIKEELSPQDMPVEYAKELELTVNETFAEAIDVDPESIK